MEQCRSKQPVEQFGKKQSNIKPGQKLLLSKLSLVELDWRLMN
jgi:hypothetical protein